MGVSMTPEPKAIAAQFAIEGRVIAIELFDGGHINDSYRVTYERKGRSSHFFLQRVNDTAFPEPARVMENIRRVTDHIAQKLKSLGVADVNRRVLTLMQTHEGRAYCRDHNGSYWRLYRFIESVPTCRAVETPEQAEQAAHAFGTFQGFLADLPGPRLHVTIPDFHNTPSRFMQLELAKEVDHCGRTAEARREIEFAFQHRDLASALLDSHQAGDIPERVVHNDAKLSNVLFDAQSGDALCVVDLDTVMPGLASYDFGDMVRSMTCTAPEDETELSRVEVRMPLFAALARGYLNATSDFLTPGERAHLVTAGKVIVLEQGVRFLADFLRGDTNYRTRRPNHNLDRCRTQFKLLESIIQHESRMVRIVERLM